MNRPLLKRFVSQALVWAGVVALCSVIALAQDAAPANGQRTDGQIEMDVVHALDGSQALKNDLITAATIQGKVTLAGTVASDADKQLAESIVKGVSGVSGVQNNLKVGNPADDQNAQGAVNDDAGSADNQDNADNQPQAAPPAQAPGYGQGQPQDNGQNQQPNYSQNPPPPGYGQAPPPPGYGQNQYPAPPPNRPQYAPAPPQGPNYEYAKGPVTVPPGTLLQLRTSEPVSSKRAVDGTPVQFTVIQDVTLGGVLAIPRGATVHGVVTDVKRTDAGSLGGSSELALRLTSLDLGGQNYPLLSDQFKVKGPNKAGRTVGNAIGGALLGAIIGGAVDRGAGAAIGAAAGAGAGTAASAASPGPNVWIPAEALVTFHLAAPVTVNPVSPEEAMRLAQGLYPGGPTLYQRRGAGYYGGYGRPYPYAAGPYPYYYGPVYYRPYYMVGGYYYWR
jgi:BON domain